MVTESSNFVGPDALAETGSVNLSRYVLGDGQEDRRLAIVDCSRLGRQREWTYAELVGSVRNLAAHLRTCGVRNGDVVGVLTENSAEFVVAFHGVLSAGATVLPLDPRAYPADWKRDIVEFGVKTLIAESALWPDPDVETALPVAQDARAQWAKILGRDGPPIGELPVGDNTAVLLSSSGTEGLPKRAIVTHRNLVAGLVQIATVHRLVANESVMAIGPLRHIYGMQMAMNPTLRERGTLIIGPTPVTPNALLRLLRERDVSVAYLVPSVIAELGETRPAGDLDHLRLVVSGGAPLPLSAAAACESALGSPVVQGFGMTEAGCVCFTPDDRRGPVGTVGIVLPGTAARLLAPGTGHEVASGTTGELWLRGPQISPGYHGGVSPRSRDDWLRTGDLAVADADGFLRIVGRAKKMIKYKGHQVSPAELENLLAAQPAVSDVLVVGAPDPTAGEIPKAYVVSDSATSLAEIAANVAALVPPQKRIRRIERVRAIPHTATGKPITPPSLCVLVTGGERGLGLEFAAGLTKRGARVLICGRDQHHLESALARLADSPGQIAAMIIDVTDASAAADAVQAVIERYGELDVVVNNAAVAGPTGPHWTTDAATWWRAIEISLRGIDLVSRAALPHLLDRSFGRIVNVISGAEGKRFPACSACAVSNAAVKALTANLAGDLHGSGIVAATYDPGRMDASVTQDGLVIGEPDATWARALPGDGYFTSIPAVVDALVRIAYGAADHCAGQTVTVRDLPPPGRAVSPNIPAH